MLLSLILAVPPQLSAPGPVQAAAPALHAAAEHELALPQAVQLALQRNAVLLQGQALRPLERLDLRAAQRQQWPLLDVAASVQHTSVDAQPGRSAQVMPQVRWLLPTGAQLSYSRSYSQNHLPLGTSLGTSAPGTSTADSLTLRQPLFKGAGPHVAGAARQQAEWQDEIARLRQRALLGQTISEVLMRYRALQRAQRAQAIAQSGVARADELLRTYQALVDVGRLAASELLQAQADQADQALALAQAGLDETNARLALSALLGLDSTVRIHPSEPLTAPLHPVPDAAEVLALALARQPEHQQTLLALQQAERQRDVARNALQPDVALVLSRASNPTLRATGAWESARSSAVGLQWTVPLNDLSAQRAQALAEATLTRSQLAVQQSQLELSLAVQQRVQTLAVLQQQLALAGTRLALSRRKLALELEKLKAGRSTSFQVLSFQADLRQAELGELDVLTQCLNAAVLLDQLQGTTLQTWHVRLDD